MATESAAAPTEASQEAIYSALENYAWAADQEFQVGLKSILAQATDPQQRQDLSLRARCFYFTRKTGNRVDFEGYKAWRQAQLSQRTEAQPAQSVQADAEPAATSNSEPQPVASPEPQAVPPTEPATSQPPSGETPYSANFQHIVELITTGAPIPGIKDIPDTIKTGEESSRSRSRRLKPWETESADTAETAPASTEVTNGETKDKQKDGVNGV